MWVGTRKGHFQSRKISDDVRAPCTLPQDRRISVLGAAVNQLSSQRADFASKAKVVEKGDVVVFGDILDGSFVEFVSFAGTWQTLGPMSRERLLWILTKESVSGFNEVS